jgi:hypothetical protein
VEADQRLRVRRVVIDTRLPAATRSEGMRLAGLQLRMWLCCEADYAGKLNPF